MFRPTEENFLQMFFSNKEVVSEVHCMDDIVYIWGDFESEEVVYLVSPSTRAKYIDFIENIKKERPLLLELL
jgi:hypothetical protein